MDDGLIKLFFIKTESQRFFHVQKKANEKILVDIEDLVLVAEVHPLHFEVFGIVGKVLDRIVGVDVIFLEVLHQDQNEQVQHNVLLHQHKNDIVNDGDGI